MSCPKMNENIKKGHAMWACPFCSTARSCPGRYLSPSRIRSVQLPSPLPKANLPRLAQLQEVHPIANAVHDDDDAAVVDFNIVGHVGVVGSGRYIERRLLGSLRVADVPRPHAAVEVRSERQLDSTDCGSSLRSNGCRSAGRAGSSCRVGISHPTADRPTASLV